MLVFGILLVVLCCYVQCFNIVGGNNGLRRHLRISMTTIGDLSSMSVKAAIQAVCGDDMLDSSLHYSNTDILKKSPGICNYIIGNPKAFLDPENKAVAALRGVDQDTLDLSRPATDLAKILPVMYLADLHSEYGMLGLRLNAKDKKRTMIDLSPELKAFRDRPVYLGGEVNSGSSFLMVHRRGGFPENRVWKGLPDNNDFKLFFSPDTAMANELCLTNDAHPNEFKFFCWTTVWVPGALELEYKKRMWLTLDAPIDVFFDDDLSATPLWHRLVRSLPEGRIFPKTSSA